MSKWLCFETYVVIFSALNGGIKEITLSTVLQRATAQNLVGLRLGAPGQANSAPWWPKEALSVEKERCPHTVPSFVPWSLPLVTTGTVMTTRAEFCKGQALSELSGTFEPFYLSYKHLFFLASEKKNKTIVLGFFALSCLRS